MPVAGAEGCLAPEDESYRDDWECGPPPAPQPQLADFLRGDVNTDGRLSLSDALAIRRFLFLRDFTFPCEEAADLDGNGEIQLTDAVRVLSAIFFGELNWPVAPFPAVGPGSTADTLGCGRYVVEESVPTSDVVEIGKVIAAPGQVVEIPVLFTNELELEAIQLVIAYDPEVLTPQALSFTGSYFEPFEDDPGLIRQIGKLTDGILAVGFIPDIIYDNYAIPPGDGQLVFSILAKVSESAVPGTIIRVAPTNGPDGQGIGIARLRNELTHRGMARYGTTLPATQPGLVQIVGDLSIFVRGDSNFDSMVDISDPVATLGYLFNGEAKLACDDAADANDDGRIDISDPIATLGHLFLGVGFLPPPSRSPGVDPTRDELGCGGD